MRNAGLLQRNKGQSMVEAAFVLPIIILILTGIIDFGLLFNNYLIVSNASREGARYAAVGYTDAEVANVVQGVSGSLEMTRLLVGVSPSELQRKKGDEVVVTVEYDYKMFTPVISAIIPNPLKLRGRTVMRIE